MKRIKIKRWLGIILLILLPCFFLIGTATPSIFKFLTLGNSTNPGVLTLHDAGTATLYDDGDNTSVQVGPVGDGTTVLAITGTINPTTLTEGGNAVYNATETPGGELGGTFASFTIDDSVEVTGWIMGTSTATSQSADDNNHRLATDFWCETTQDYLKTIQNFTTSGTIQATDNADATPDVSNAAIGYNNIYESDENGTITNFDDGAEPWEDEFANGDWFIFLVTDASTSIDFTTAAIKGNAGVTFTGHADHPTLILFIYENARWNTPTFTTGMSTPITLALSSIDMGGGVVEIPNGDAIDCSSNTGEFGLDTDGWFRINDGVAEKGVPISETIHATVIAPNDLADATRDKCPIWSNESGMSFVTTKIEAWADTDDTAFVIDEFDADGSSGTAEVDALNCTTGSGPYTATETPSITIEADHTLWIDFDDTDDPGWVKVSITGYYLGDVD